MFEVFARKLYCKTLSNLITSVFLTSFNTFSARFILTVVRETSKTSAMTWLSHHQNYKYRYDHFDFIHHSLNKTIWTFLSKILKFYNFHAVNICGFIPIDMLLKLDCYLSKWLDVLSWRSVVVLENLVIMHLRTRAYVFYTSAKVIIE